MNSALLAIANVLAAWLLGQAPVFPPAQAFFGDFLCRRPGLPSAADSPLVAKAQPVPAIGIEAESAAVLALGPNVFLLEEDDRQIRSIASITKLMTALVFLEHNPGWEEEYTIRSKDMVVGGINHLFPGDTVRVRDLFYASLVASDNVATQALSSATGLSEAEFVAAMDAKADAMGLLSTSFVDPVGLDDGNLSSARDIARLAKEAFSHPDVRAAVLEPSFSFTTAQGKERSVASTDYFTAGGGEDIVLIGGKTGYTEAAGYCFVGQFSDGNGREVVAVVLGTDSKQKRFDETEKAVRWSLANFAW